MIPTPPLTPRPHPFRYERDALRSRVTGLTDNDSAWAKHFGQADMVIEAVFEDMAVKHKVVAEMEAVLPEFGK
jgi:enoyl-CoA hydratase/long-chain 3-hydroxyacyl-CoA dehydrogenase